MDTSITAGRQVKRKCPSLWLLWSGMAQNIRAVKVLNGSLLTFVDFQMDSDSSIPTYSYFALLPNEVVDPHDHQSLIQTIAPMM